jgi:hypothetical protein
MFRPIKKIAPGAIPPAGASLCAKPKTLKTPGVIFSSEKVVVHPDGFVQARDLTITSSHITPDGGTVPTVNARFIIWRDGKPMPATRPIIPKEEYQNILLAALSLPYDGPEPEYQNLSNIEVAILKHVEQVAAKPTAKRLFPILDRTMGKPMQTIKTTSLTGDLNQFLDQIREERNLGFSTI